MVPRELLTAALQGDSRLIWGLIGLIGLILVVGEILGGGGPKNRR